MERTWQRAPSAAEIGRDAEDRMQHYLGMKEELAALRASASSPHREVTVVAGSAGAIRDIRFTEEALRGGAQALSRTVLATIHTAVAQAARSSAEIVQRYAGDRMDIVNRVLATQEQAFGTAASPPRRDDGDDPSGTVARSSASGPARSAAPPEPTPAADTEYLRLFGGGE